MSLEPVGTDPAAQPGDSDLRFADALRAAVLASGLALERIQHRLRERGADVSIATLSYWQSGRSLPGRRGSFVVLSELEDILGLAPGALANLVPPRTADVRGVDSVATFAASMGHGIQIPQSFAELDARLRRQFEMVSEHALVKIGPDRTQRSRWTRRILRAVADGVDRLLIADFVEDESVPPPTLIPLTHCTLGERHVLPESGFVITELLFDRVLAEGESIIVEYELDYGPPYPLDTSHEVHKQMPLREFVLEVRFHEDALPAQVEWFEYPTRDADAQQQVRQQKLDETNSVVVVRHALPPTRFGMRWSWGDEPGLEGGPVADA